ncbi:putative Protein transport protein yif1 [Trypanosoma vivax]|uniref:Protein YIF1 n=1 Tax=Trypanosoma vivax (strain Y486) TaxID=1055687 RepID=G0TR80_TRYVY|nr:hypothetical protein TRVL_07820 [Trypanosoma vivax]KAH8611758.1 putative Protein transport protein yif1 [Trypanosoma vivax]CCC46444.1 conserved hypothetical protein [Trypanosoma vivax Y486]
MRAIVHLLRVKAEVVPQPCASRLRRQAVGDRWKGRCFSCTEGSKGCALFGLVDTRRKREEMAEFGQGKQPMKQRTQYVSTPLAPWENAQSNMMLQMGLNYGQSVLQNGEQSILRHMPFISGFRRYFRVDNQYVKGKLSMLLCPFFCKFQRPMEGHGDENEVSTPTVFSGDGSPSSIPPERSPTTTSGGMYLASSPMNDVHAFDLYLPLMGAVTYIILSGFLHGLHHGIVTTENLLGCAWALIFWLVLEVVILKVACYILQVVPAATTLDLVSLCSYKYIPICLIVLLRELIQLENDAVYFGAMVAYTLFANSFFVSKTTMRMYRRQQRVSQNAKVFVLVAVLLQTPIYMWLSWRPFR